MNARSLALVIGSAAITSVAGAAWPLPAQTQESLSTAQIDQLAEAAASGDPEAQYEYGRLYSVGAQDITVDYEAAAEWYRLAAAQDHLGATLSLSTMLLQRDPPEAIRLVLRAAELGSSEAQWRAGQIYSRRIFVPLAGLDLNRELALDWFKRAVEQGHHLAEEALADLYTDSDESSLYGAALDLYLKAAAGGAGWAALRLGMMYSIGEGVEENDAAAFGWFSRLGSEFQLNPDRFSPADLEVLGGLQDYYGLDFLGGDIERDLGAATEALTSAVQLMEGQLFQPFVHASFGRTAQRILGRLQNELTP